MKPTACLICTVTIILINAISSSADYDKKKVEIALGQFLAFNNTLEALSNTECAPYISIDHKKYNVRDEAEKYLIANDYNGFLMYLDSENYRIGQNKILQNIENGIIKRKSEGLRTEQLCKELAQIVEQSYIGALEQWNEQNNHRRAKISPFLAKLRCIHAEFTRIPRPKPANPPPIT